MHPPTSLGLAESEELLALAQEAGRVGIFEWQVPTGMVRLSPKFLSLYGRTDFDAASTAGGAAFSERIRPTSTVSSMKRSPKTPPNGKPSSALSARWTVR